MEMIRLHLGCGTHTKPDWVNIDIGPNPNTGHTYLQKDLSDGLPVTMPDNSVDFITSEHFLEHLTREQALVLMKSCYNKLKPGGVMRVVVPNLEDAVRRYLTNNLDFGGPTGYSPRNACQMINDAFHEWGHQFMYDTPELLILLKEAGFIKDFKRIYNPGESEHSELRNTDIRLNSEDIRVEVTK